MGNRCKVQSWFVLGLSIAAPWLASCGASPSSSNNSSGGSGSGGAASAPKGSDAGAHDAGKSPGTSGAHDGGTGTAGKSAADAGPSKPGADAGGTRPTDAGGATGPAVAFRVTELTLRDPHFFLGTTDITDTPVLGTSVNGSLIPGGLTMDYDGDGFLDVSILLLLQPLDPAASGGHLSMIDGHCKLSDPTQCQSVMNPGLNASFPLDNHAQGSCLEPVAGTTTSSFTPAVSTPAGPCFVTTTPADLTINLGGISIGVTSATVAATYQGTPPNQLVSGLIAGFVTNAKAMQAVLPSYLGPGLAGSPLTDFLRAQDRDMAKSPNGEDGWWLYLNFVAKPVTYAK
jgi:hypothetical protein